MKIEVDGPRNECLSFAPIQRKVRGRFCYLRDSEPQSKMFDHPAIPGQRLGFADGKGFIEESLYDDEHEPVREKLEAKGYKLPPKRQEFDGDESTWLWWMQRAVESGIAKIVSGKAKAIDESKVQKSFIVKERPSSEDKLTAALDRQSDLFEKLLTKLAG